VNQQFMEAISRSDAAGVAVLYAEHGQLMPPNSEVLKGRQAIGEYFESAIDSGLGSVQLETSELDIYGSMAVEIGRYQFHEKNDKQIDVGKYIVIWQFVNGKWCLFRDIFNSDLPTA